jgi:hypothetical protein
MDTGRCTTVFTGMPVIVQDVIIDRLTAEEADDMVDLLNLKAARRRGVVKRP